MGKGRTRENCHIQRPLKEVDAKIQMTVQELTVSPWQSSLGRESRYQLQWLFSLFAAPAVMWGCCLQPWCHSSGHSMDGKQMERSFFMQRPPSLNARRHNREEIPWLSCNPVRRIWPHKYTPCGNPVYENDGCHILFFATHQKQSSGGFLCWEIYACCT